MFPRIASHIRWRRRVWLTDKTTAMSGRADLTTWAPQLQHYVHQYHQKDWKWIQCSLTLYHFQVWIIFSPVFLSSLSWISRSCKCTWTNNKGAPTASSLYCCCCCGLYNYLLFVKTSTLTESFLKSSASVLVVLMNTEHWTGPLNENSISRKKVIDDLACEQKWNLSRPLVVWNFCRLA